MLVIRLHQCVNVDNRVKMISKRTTSSLDDKQRRQPEMSVDNRSDEVITTLGLWQWSIEHFSELFPAVQADEQKASDYERLERIFNQLDRSGNGRIDIHDLSASFKAFGMSEKYAAVSIVFTCLQMHISMSLYRSYVLFRVRMR